MNEKTMVPSDAMSRVYPPSRPVMVPVVVPLTTTFTPGKPAGSVSEVTLPVTRIVCAEIENVTRKRSRRGSLFIGTFPTV